MDVGRLAWRTPTGAMLWEIWGRHKVKFLWDGAALAASCFFVLWRGHGVSQAVGEMLGCAAFFFFLGGYGQLLVCLGWFEVDDRTVQFSFPGRLLLKPVGTARLVLVPMLFGGAVIVTVSVLWAELAWRHVVGFSTSDLLWTSAVLLSFFWWLQALAWSLPLPKARMLAMVMMGLLHFFIWRMPQMRANALSGWQWPILSVLLASAVPVAWTGLKQMRQGSWEGPSRISTLWSRLRFARARTSRKKFRSAFGAQFWLEWRRQGWLLPGISGGMAFSIVAIYETASFMIHKFSGATWQGGDPEMVGLLYMFILPLMVLPLVLSNLLAPALATFDRFHLAGVPGFIAVRPMTNGGFVMAKLAMALVTSILTWLVTALAFLCLALMEKEILLSKDGLVTPFGPVAFLAGCVPVLLLLVIWTWKNLAAGIGAGMTGRPWIWMASVYWRMILLVGLFPLVGTARTNVNFRETLFHWLTAILIACLAAKIVVSIAAFACGLRRNAITARAIGWIAGGWLVCGLFVAGYAGHVCSAIHQPGLRLWVALGGFLLLPLADLAIAPLALAWNRHR
ncbi:MAG: hypothetical protein WAO21_08050 [Verrucomicrobiia bacterium]